VMNGIFWVLLLGAANGKRDLPEFRPLHDHSFVAWRLATRPGLTQEMKSTRLSVSSKVSAVCSWHEPEVSTRGAYVG
jgi:hypothetical protein